MQIQAVKVRRLYLEVANQIKQLILSGELQPGDRLPAERDLASRFQVSRPTIREAMIALEIDGQIEIRAGAGSFISADPAAQKPELLDQGPGPFEILEARRVLEAETVALAAERITHEQLGALEDALEIIERENAEGNLTDATEEADERFHCTIAEASQNSALATAIRWLWELRRQSAIGKLYYRRLLDNGVQPSVEEHRAILDALRKRDPQSARAAMTAHLSRVIDGETEVTDAKNRESH